MQLSSMFVTGAFILTLLGTAQGASAQGETAPARKSPESASLEQDERYQGEDTLHRRGPAVDSGTTTARPPSTETLDEMVVTASRRPTRLESAPAVVNVITREDIQRLPAQNLAELIRDEVGIVLKQPQGAGIVTPQSVGIRGLDFERILLLVDGQPWNSGFTDYFYLSTIPLDAVERIEIVRGPFSSLYGTNALGGVIHVFTRDGRGSAFDGLLSTRLGDFGRFETTESLGGSLDEKASAFITHNHFESDNYFLNDDRPDVIDPRNRGYTHERFHGHMAFMPAPNLELRLSGGAYSSETGYGIGESFGIEKHQDVNNYYLNGRGTWTANDRLQLFFGSDHLSNDFEFTGETLTRVVMFPRPPRFVFEPSQDHYGFDRTRAYLGGNLEVFSGNILTLGGEVQWNRGFKRVSNLDTDAILPVLNRPGQELDELEGNYAFYLHDDWLFLNDRLELILGLRYDNFEGFGDHLSPKAALNWYYWESGRVKLSAGNAFRAPAMNQRLTPAWTLAPFVTFVANADLEAETLWSYELSFENEFLGKKLKTRVTPFMTFADDFITIATLPDPLDPSRRSLIKQPQNIQSVRIEGVETEVALRPVEELKLYANYQYAEVRDDDTDRILDNHPLNTARMGAVWYSRHYADLLGVTASLVAVYESGRNFTELRTGRLGSIGGYTTLDTRIGMDFWKRRFSVFGDIYNLLDKQTYKTGTDDFLPGRNWLLGLQINYRF